MNRLVIQLHGAVAPDGSPYMAIALEEPVVQNTIDRPFPCRADEAAFTALSAAVLAADSVKAAGGRLYEAITAHPDVGQYLQTALQAHERYPVFIEINTNEGAEALPWEALCSPAGDYLGLDARWSLARMVQPGYPAPPPFYTLEPPLRVAAVLSCLGVPADGELKALRDAVQGNPHVKLLVIASEEQLVVGLQAEIDAGTAPEVEAVRLVPGDLGELKQMVSDFGPHVLHFFCHGSAEGTPHLRLALKSDWESANPTSGLLAEVRDFDGFTRATDDLPWLVVLNCCEGAAAGVAREAQSLALGLAATGFAPAVLGMREPIVSDTANLVTRALYRSLFAEVLGRAALPPGQPAPPVDWPQLVVAARDRLARTYDGLVLSQAAASTKEWTLPVVYVRPEPFDLLVVPHDAQQPAEEPPAPPPGPPPPPPSGPPHDALGPPPMSVPVPAGPAGPPVPDGDERAREARLEIETLRALLSALPPGQAAELREEAQHRIDVLSAQLGAPRSTAPGALPAQ